MMLFWLAIAAAGGFYVGVFLMGALCGQAD